MGKLTVSYNKNLKLTNALCLELVEEDYSDLEKVLYQMENYIRAKGALPLGPLVQCTTLCPDAEGNPHVSIQFIQQANKLIPNVSSPYTMHDLFRVPNCLFVRFCGDEGQLKFAYDKLNLISFEEDIPLTGRTFTVFTNQSDEFFTADVFMEKNTSN